MSWPPTYSFLDKAAAEARAASRRYWAKGGEADKRYPQQPMPWWPETPEAGGLDAVEQKASRQWIKKPREV